MKYDIADNVPEQSVCQALSLTGRIGRPASLPPHEKEGSSYHEIQI